MGEGADMFLTEQAVPDPKNRDHLGPEKSTYIVHTADCILY